MESVPHAASYDALDTLADTTPELGDAPLHGAWLVLARLASAGIVVFALSVFLASAPTTLSLLREVCAANCSPWQLTQSQASTLAQYGISPDMYAFYLITLTLLTCLIWFGAAALIFWRRSNTVFLLLTATQLVTQGALNTPAGSSLGGLAPGSFALACLVTLSGCLFLLFLALFPTGRFAPRWMGWLLIPIIAVLIVAQFLPAQYPAQSDIFAICILGLIVAQAYRFRAVYTALQRQQTRWVIVGIGTYLVTRLTLSALPVFEPALTMPDSPYPTLAASLEMLTLALGPIAFTIAVLRYRLFDLGLLLNRTLVYGSLTALLAMVYVGCVISLQAAVRGVTGQRDSAIAIVVSTLLIAALFQPLRRVLQTVIDQRFYRRKYDTAKTLAAFSAVLRSEVDLDTLSRELIEVVHSSVQPMDAWLWLRPEPGSPPHEGQSVSQPTSTHAAFPQKADGSTGYRQ